MDNETAPYLRVLDRVDRYRKAGAPKEVYDAAARERLFAKLNRVVAQIEAGARRSARRAAAGHGPGGEADIQPDSDKTLSETMT